MPLSLRGVLPALLFAVSAAPSLAADTVPAPDLKVGDTWVYDQTTERGTAAFGEQRLDLKVERIGDDDTMVVGIKADGAPTDYQDHIAGRDWSLRRVVDGRQTTTGRPLAFPLFVGKTWTTDYVDPNRHGLQTSAKFHASYKATGWEDVTTPAGVFHALRIEANGTAEATMAPAVGVVSGGVASTGETTTTTRTQAAGPHTVYETTYGVFDYAPRALAMVKSVEEKYDAEGVRTSRVTRTLASDKLGS